MTDRRQFLQGMAALTVLPVGCGGGAPADTLWVSAEGADGVFSLVAGSAEGLVVRVPSAFRGHGSAWHPAWAERVVMFARRPGTSAAVVDLAEGRVLHALDAPPGMLVQGHGAFSADGGLLYVALAHEHTAEGSVGVWRTDTWAQVGELDSFGIGPHELRLMPDGATLVIANGGLLTRPKTGAQVLNLATMDSSLVFVEAATGDLIEQVRVPEPKASMRHLAVADDGTVVVGAQIQREAVGHDEVLPLVAIHRPGQGLEVLEVSELVAAMNDYVGSVAVSSQARVAATSSPRGDLVLFWGLDTGRLLGHHALADVCGLAVDEAAGCFLLSSSHGQVRSIDALSLEERSDARRTFDGVRWDNHLTTVTL